jgi:fatty-acyl-CoA synthase
MSRYAQQSHFVTDWLEKRAQLTPQRVGLTDTIAGRDWTFAEWNARANRTANLLRVLGVRIGDLVSVYASNCTEYLDLLFACGKLGAILHNLNWRLTVHELRSVLEEARPRVLCYGPDWSAQVDALRPALRWVQHFIALSGPGPGDVDFAIRDVASSELHDRPELRLDHPWAIYYTGGTTGTPKGAVLTHGNMTWNSINTVTSWGLTADHASALQLPFFHIGGPNIFMLPLVHVGGRTVLCRSFDLEQTFDLIDNGAVTHVVGVPTMYIMMQQHARWNSTDFSRLALVISGGAPCPLAVMERFWARGVDFKTGYGLTEASGNNFWLPPADVRRKPGSVGFPLFHIDIRIAREDGTECEADEPGELLIRGPHVFAGYWNRPDATADVLRDGWLHTGDLGRRDAEGYTTIVGRKKDMFISGGENVYPAEVESALHAHPAVADAALIAVPHDKWGEVGRAVVVVAEGQQLSADALLGFLGERLARYKLPQSVVFVDALPRTAIGKTDKLRLAREFG